MPRSTPRSSGWPPVGLKGQVFVVGVCGLEVRVGVGVEVGLVCHGHGLGMGLEAHLVGWGLDGHGVGLLVALE